MTVVLLPLSTCDTKFSDNVSSLIGWSAIKPSILMQTSAFLLTAEPTQIVSCFLVEVTFHSSDQSVWMLAERGALLTLISIRGLHIKMDEVFATVPLQLDSVLVENGRTNLSPFCSTLFRANFNLADVTLPVEASLMYVALTVTVQSWPILRTHGFMEP